MRRNKSLQDQADAIFGDFVGDLARLTAELRSDSPVAAMGERMRLATKYASLVSFGGRVPIDSVSLCDNLSLAQLKVLCSTAQLPASAAAGKLRPALRQHLAAVGARDAELARDGANMNAMDAAELSKLCEERGIGGTGYGVDEGTSAREEGGGTDRQRSPKITVQEQLADLQTWVHTTSGSASGTQPSAPPLFALMCQVEDFPDYEHRREQNAASKWPWQLWRRDNE